MPPLWWVEMFTPCWVRTHPHPGLDCNWWATGERFRGVLHLSTEVFQAILTELTINTQPNTKEANSFQSFVHESQDCTTAGCLCQVWVHQQWALGWGPGEAIWDTTACQLPEERGASQPTHKAESSPSPQKLVLVWREQAQSLQQEGWSQASVGNWIPWDLDP